MILAEKIMDLRKKNGWSQEELAMQLNVSRQSVSKWESAASIPDLDKIIKLSQIFGVSTDYLLKDDLEEDPQSPTVDVYEEEQLRSVSLEEANTYMDKVEKLSRRISAAISMFILSPVILILMGGRAEYGKMPLTEDMAAGIGVAILLLIIALGLVVLLPPCMELEKYEYLEKEVFIQGYGVTGAVQKRKDDFESTYRTSIVMGIVFCIIGIIPLMIMTALDVPEVTYLYGVSIILLCVSIGTNILVRAGMIHESHTALLQQEDYTPEKKREGRKNEKIGTIYWCVVTAIYLAWSFHTGAWKETWIVWPVAGVLFAAVLGTASLFGKKRS